MSYDTHVLKFTTQSKRWFTSCQCNLYWHTLGKLQFLSFTRPDIAFAVKKSSQFMQSPSLEHQKAVKKVLRYLKASGTSCLQLSRHSDNNLYMYVDNDWVGDPCDRISTSGYILFLGTNPKKNMNRLSMHSVRLLGYTTCWMSYNIKSHKRQAFFVITLVSHISTKYQSSTLRLSTL